jgi:nucleotide-binding universal stress UspA family protein
MAVRFAGQSGRGSVDGSRAAPKVATDRDQARKHGGVSVYKHILIATDGSDLALKAVVTGLSLAKALNARATAITVSEPWTSYVTSEAMIAFPIEDYEKSAASEAATALGAVSNVARDIGVACTTQHIKERYPADGILEAAETNGCDLIVMASHGRRGIARLLLGSQALQVLTHSKLPVLICR